MTGAKPSYTQQEIRQRKPFRSAAHEAVVALARTADLFQRNFSKIVDPVGLSSEQYNVLRILRGAGEEGLPTLEIGARMIQQTPGITRILDKLEAKKLVRRERCKHDRRQVLCWIRPLGEELLARLDAEVDRNEIENLRGLTVAEQKQLICLLDRVRAAHKGNREANEPGAGRGL